MGDAEDATALVWHEGRHDPGGFSMGKPPAIAYEALRRLREHPGAVERVGAFIQGELVRRRKLFGGTSDDTARR